MPLAAASIACGIVGWIVRGQESAGSSREFPIWGLFVALAIIAGMGALVSFMIDDEEAPVPRPRRRALRTADREEPEAILSVEDQLDDLDAGDSSAGSPRRGPDKDWDTAPPARRPVTGRSQPPVTTAIDVDLEGLESPGAAEAIAEIDILWSDLERMRRQRTRGPRAGSA